MLCVFGFGIISYNELSLCFDISSVLLDQLSVHATDRVISIFFSRNQHLFTPSEKMNT